MKILIVKMSSMGDVLHSFPAIVDIRRELPTAEIHWVVEEKFQHMLDWLPQVDKVIPIALRRWRKRPWRYLTEIKQFYRQLRQQRYDFVIDAQGLLKSALITRLARGKRFGYDKTSAREALASYFYPNKINVSKDLHAVIRTRLLCAKSLSFSLQLPTIDYGIDRQKLAIGATHQDHILLVHGTTWDNKHWPESYWRELATLLDNAAIPTAVCWGSNTEFERAKRIAADLKHVAVLPDLNIPGVTRELASARGVVAVDTGFAHIATALDVPTVGLYGPTAATRCGVIGPHQQSLQADFSCAPCNKRECHFGGKSSVQPACFATITPQMTYNALDNLLNSAN